MCDVDEHAQRHDAVVDGGHCVGGDDCGEGVVIGIHVVLMSIEEMTNSLLL